MFMANYKFTGYGIMSRGNSVKMFEGTDQQLFLGGKNALTVGLSNTFTVGIKSDVMVGASVSMGLAPWDWDKPGGLQTGHLTAKYDFSTNKSFAFQIAPEGSSNYVTQSKFNCELGFQAVAGFQTAGEKLYDAYKTTLSRMGTLVALTNFVSSLAIVYKTYPDPDKDDKVGKGDLTVKDAQGNLKDDDTLQNFANTSAWAATGTSTGVATAAAIYAAIQRETSFKPWIHPQSVIDLKPEHVFLGAMGDTLLPANQSGASLVLKNGTATLGARKYLVVDPKPFIDKNFNDFTLAPTTSLEIDPTSIVGIAENAISIAAGAAPGYDPVLKGVVAAKRVLRNLQATTAKAAKAAHDKVMLVPNPDLIAQGALANAAKDSVEIAAQPAILAAQAAVIAAESVYKTNPSLYLSAGSAVGGLLSKIEATSPSFNVISSSISLSDTQIPIRGLFVKKVPPSIQLVQSAVSKISMSPNGAISLIANPTTSMNLGPTSISIKMGASSIGMSPTVAEIKTGGTKIQLFPGIVKVGNSLKVIG